MITWDTTLSINGTSFRAILNSPYAFWPTVERLKTLSGQNPQPTRDMKARVNFIGRFGDEVFTLYDYRGDERIHIGGRQTLDTVALSDVLLTMLNNERVV